MSETICGVLEKESRAAEFTQVSITLTQSHRGDPQRDPQVTHSVRLDSSKSGL